jgi:choline dehydrogenase-like flavoprotein
MDGSSSVRGGEEFAPDLCIVGAGPAGITIAQELDRLGMSVLLVEAGGLEVDATVQNQSRGESDGYPLHLLHHSRVRAFGGTLRHSRLWDEGWAARPLDPIDFEERARLTDVAWPFCLGDLEPFYERAVKLCGIQPFDTASTAWYQDAPLAARSLMGGELEPMVFQFPTVAFHDAWSELSASEDVHVLLHTRVTDIELDATGKRVRRVNAVRPDGSRLSVHPRVLVIATGGIENARLLLTSDRGRGIGNAHGLVGRYFAERLSFFAGYVDLSDGTSVDDLDLFQRPGMSATGGGLRVTDSVQREAGFLNCALFLIPRPDLVTSPAVRSMAALRRVPDRRPHVPAIRRHVRNVLTGLPDLVGMVLNRSRTRTLALRVQGEQSPNPESRVTLGRGRDDLGIPVARVTWAMTELDKSSTRSAADVLDRNLRDQGLGAVRWTAHLESTTLIEGNHHHLGTTRMHEDADRGVVDPDGKVHGIENLYVAGSSVFPSHGASNPTLTIIALALSLADRLRWLLDFV